MSGDPSAWDSAAQVVSGLSRSADELVIARFQSLHDRRIGISDGAVERASDGRTRGVGVQVILDGGASGFAASDRDDAATVRGLVDRARALARAGTPARWWRPWPPPAANWSVPAPDPSLAASVSIREQAERLHELWGEVSSGLDIGAVRAAFASYDEQWRIVRSDGVDVSIDYPRTVTRADFVLARDGLARGLGAQVGVGHLDALTDETARRLLIRRALTAGRHLATCHDAPPPRTGPATLVLDHSLAKGLAHEAFGHALEADLLDDSFLGDGGVARLGQRVGASIVSIVDGPVDDDFGSIQISANGRPRRTVTLVDRGQLSGVLADEFCDPVGAGDSDAARTAWYREPPCVRMSNIRLVVEGAIEDGELGVGDSDPERIREVLARHGLLDPRGTFMLGGYRGGQAHPSTGEFVFSAAYGYDLTSGVRPIGHTTFGGKAIGALSSVVAGLGEVISDAVSHCNKNGRWVATSGGANRHVVLAPHPDVGILGGDR